MRTLQEADIIRIMREEWDLRVKRLLEEAQPGLKFDTDGDGTDDELISPELKVLHSDSKVRYTVHSVGPDDVVLRTPEGEKILVDKATLEKEYVLD
jgi:hypothetical protein